MRMTERALTETARRRAQMAMAVIAIRKAEAHLYAGNNESLIEFALDEATAAIARAFLAPAINQQAGGRDE